MRLDFYTLRVADNVLIISSYEIEVKGFRVYVVEGKTFAYGIEGVPIACTEEGYKVYFVAIISGYYIDENGDGILKRITQTNCRTKPWVGYQITKQNRQEFTKIACWKRY